MEIADLDPLGAKHFYKTTLCCSEETRMGGSFAHNC